MGEHKTISDAVFQLLQVLAYLAIGLLSVTFPVYAISVNYLPAEKWETEKKHQKRIAELTKKITDLTSELPKQDKNTEKIEKQISVYKAELKKLEKRVGCLTARGAVRDNIAFLASALSLAIAGLALLNVGLEEVAGNLLGVTMGILSATFSGFALRSLYSTVCVVESAALRPSRTVEFKIFFDPSEEEVQEVAVNSRTRIDVGAQPEDNVSDFVMMVTVPKELEIEELHGGEDFSYSYFEDQIVVATKKTYLPQGTMTYAGFFVKPRKIGESKILVSAFGKGVSRYSKVLTVRAIKK